MCRHVAPNAVTKNIFAKKTLQHEQESLPLAISNIVEGVISFLFVCDRLLDWVSCRSCIAFHLQFLRYTGASGRITRNIFLKPDFPLRIEMRRALRSHPRSETFIQPKIIPPGHGHEIAEPLVRGLVRDHFINPLPRHGGRFLRVEQESRFEISDAAPIFHRITECARNGDLIQLRQRVMDAEIVIVIV